MRPASTLAAEVEWRDPADWAAAGPAGPPSLVPRTGQRCVLVAAAEPVLAQGIARLVAEDLSGAALDRADSTPPRSARAAPSDVGQPGADGWRLTPLETVTTVGAAERALALYRPPLAVLVLDPPLAGTPTETACVRLVAAQPATAALVLLAHPTPERVRHVSRCGARGIFDTAVEPATLVAALREIDDGGVVVQPSLVQYLLGETESPPAPPSGQRLNARALTALQLLARGYASKEIAPILGTTPKAVNLTIERACRQLGATTRSEAVAIAIGRGLIS